MDSPFATARNSSTGSAPQRPRPVRELNLGLSKQDALSAILEIFSRLEQNHDGVDVPGILNQMAKYFGRSLTPSPSGKLEFDLNRNDWRIWSKYKKVLSDFHSGHAQILRSEIIREYEELRGILSTDEPWVLVDENFTALATKISALAPQPPPDVDIKYWYSITPHVFTSAAARRAILRVGMLHQEFQWATYSDSPTKQVWLFVWRSLKQLWNSHKLNEQPYPNAIHAAVSQLEEPFLEQHNSTFSHINTTFEVLHHDQAELMVADFASRCYATFSTAQQSALLASSRLDENSKQCLHEFIHGEGDFTVKTIEILRKAAGQYHAQMLLDLQDSEDMTSNIEESVVDQPHAEQTNAYPLPLSLPRRSVYDYVWYPFPDTRAREFAESNLIQRDMTTPGIQSDGIRACELINIPPRHARRPGCISRWNKYSPWMGAFSVGLRIAKFMLLDKKIVRPRPKLPARISKGRFSKEQSTPSLSSSDHRGKLTQSSKTSAVLHPIRDNARRVSKPTAQAQLPKVKLRGGGSHGTKPGSSRRGSSSKFSDKSNPDENEENARHTLHTRQDKPASLNSLAHSSQDAKFPPSEPDGLEDPFTPPGRNTADNNPRREIHLNSKGLPTDSHPGDSHQSSMREVTPEVLPESPTAVKLRLLALRKQQAMEPSKGLGGRRPSWMGTLPPARPDSSDAQTGISDHIRRYEDGERRLSQSEHESFQDPEIGFLGPEDQENQQPQCHPCPYYHGQYHHVCDGRCIAYEPRAAEINAEISNGLTGPRSLPVDPRASPNVLFVQDVKAIITRSSEGARLNEAQLHVRLRRINAIANGYARSLDMVRDVQPPEWGAFVLADRILPDSPLGLENFPGGLETSEDLDIKRERVIFARRLIAEHYRRDDEGRLQNMSIRARNNERLRTFTEYREQAMDLQVKLQHLAELFQEMNTLAGSDRVRRSHREHHDGFRLVNDRLLVLRRGLGQHITNEEYDDIPDWTHYRGQGLAPHNQLHAMVMQAAEAVDPIIDFFESGDSSLAAETQILQDVVTSLRDILYASAGQEQEIEEWIERQTNQDGARSTSMEERIDLTKESRKSNESSRGSRTSKRKGSQEQHESSPREKKRKTSTEEHAAEENTKKDTPEADESADKAEVPTRQDYNDMMYVDELKAEALHRGIEENKLQKKAQVVQLLVEADANGNRGLGVMRSWRMMTGKKAKEGKRPADYQLPSVEEVKEKFGTRLV